MNTRIRLALDWTPNTNHTGFYVALAKGAYAQAGLDVEFIIPDLETCQTKPAQQIAEGEADIALTPSESVIGYQLNGIPLVAVATVLARDASAIVTLKQSGIDRPKELDGKVYGSCAARYEGDIVRQMIQNDGGRGRFVMRKPARSNSLRALITNEVDATWIFLPWAGVEADIEGIELNQFLFDEYEIPYAYNPVITVHRNWADQNTDALRRFIKATTAGFRFAVDNPDEAARLLAETARHPSLKDRNFLEQSQQVASRYYFDGEGQWGFMHRNVWKSFTNWLIRNHLITDADGELVQQIEVDRLFTTEYLAEVPIVIR
ncbi:ABC transporter substrate-binding protein [Spirosoma taeanense]|uniref:Thiamine pyrimidine synthase n=1 Tax=Spirosoma taeanense TaxID=2735870 RepID=A0A6M5YB69_9BACT|nr:ABC transporter substrate-binding protein [Spirosoma taeanense]QJW91235.1 ABC transporter substrate-binding protein [Spirosoma taeanense]